MAEVFGGGEGQCQGWEAHIVEERGVTHARHNSPSGGQGRQEEPTPGMLPRWHKKQPTMNPTMPRVREGTYGC